MHARFWSAVVTALGLSLTPQAAHADEKPRFCAALRGNGNYVITHFTALARLTEHYGAFDGLAGGSSASISVFLYESMAMNPLLKTCGARACTDAEAALRLALLLKSVQAYVTAIATGTDEALAVRGLAPIAERVQKEGVKALLDLHPIEAAARLRTVLTSPDLRDLINPEIVAMLSDLPHLKRNVAEVYAAVTGFGGFKATDPLIFFRPGVLSFAGLAAKIGRMGSFYAGYGPVDTAGFAAFFAACSGEETRGKAWDEIAAANAACGPAFAGLVLDYRKKFVAAEQSTRSRIDDLVGAHLHAAIATAVVDGPRTLSAFAASAQRYLRGEPLAFAPHFEDVRIGYFTSARDAERVAANPGGYKDVKTAKRAALGVASWRTALTLSPAEPGLSSLKPMGGGKISAAGWPDLHPVQTLKNLGCETVVYITRQGEDSAFGRGIARLFGATPADEAALYDLDEPTSGFSTALAAADAVWCTSWDSFKDAEIGAMAADAYRAPLLTTAAFFAAGAHPYANRVASAGLRGCAAGARARALAR